MHATCTAVYDLKYDTDVCLVNFKHSNETTPFTGATPPPPPAPTKKFKFINSPNKITENRPRTYPWKLNLSHRTPSHPPGKIFRDPRMFSVGFFRLFLGGGGGASVFYFNLGLPTTHLLDPNSYLKVNNSV